MKRWLGWLAGALVTLAGVVLNELIGDALTSLSWVAAVVLLLGAVAWAWQQLQRRRGAGEGEEPARVDRPVPVPPPPALVGRAAALAGALERTRRERVLLLHGPRGIGTSALAKAVAGALTAGDADAGAYADLRAGEAGGKESPARARVRVLAALGLPPARSPSAEETYELVERALRGTGRVLLLDNVRDRDQVDWLLRPVPGAYVLLAGDVQPWPGVPGLPVGPLEPEDGLALLRADPAVAPRLVARKETADLARRYLKFPTVVLALRSWLADNPRVGVRALLADLDGRPWPAGGEPGEPSGLLREVFALHTEGMRREGRQLLSLLPHVPLTWLTVAAAAELLDRSPADTRQVLRELARAGLLEADSSNRYRVPREARSLGLGAPPEPLDRALGRLVAHYAGAAAERREALDRPGSAGAASEGTAVAWFRQEDTALLTLLRMAAEEPLPAGAARRVAVLGDALDVWFVRDGRRADRRDAAAAAADAARALGDVDGEVTALLRLAAVARADGELGAAEGHLARVKELGRAADPRVIVADGQLAHALGDPAGAQRQFERNLQRRPRADLVGAVVDQLDIGAALVAQDDLDGGLRRLKEAQEIAEDAGDLAGLAYGLELQGVVEARRAEPEQALAHWEEAQVRYEQLHDSDGLARCLLHRATVLRAREPETARQLLLDSVARRGPTGVGVALAHAHLADLATDPAAADRHRALGLAALAPWQDRVQRPAEVIELRERLEPVTNSSA